MSNQKAMMLNRRAAQSQFKADQILQALSLKPGQIIADIGSGGGYFTYKFAHAVGNTGRVYAVDTNPELLEFIKRTAAEQGLHNIVTLLASSEYPELPVSLFDYVFLRNVTHHLSHRIEYFQRLIKTFKPTGSLIIIEYDGRGGFFSFPRVHRHFVPREILLEEITQAGYVLQKSYDFLSTQSFTIWAVK